MSTSMDYLPRGPVAMGKSGRVDLSDGYTRATLDWRESAREEAVAEYRCNLEADQTDLYQRYLEGNQWDKRRPRYRSKFVDNRMAQARIETLSLLTDIRPTIDVTCREEQYKDQAEVIKKCIFHEWSRLNLDLMLVRAVDQALFGVGYWKIGAIMPGQFIITPLGMDQVLPIQCGWDVQESAGILYRTYKSVSYFRRWGEKARDIEREQAASLIGGSTNDYFRPDHINETTWNAMAPQMRRLVGSRTPSRMHSLQATSFPSIPLEEYWVDDPSVNESSETVTVKDPDKSEEEHNYWYRVDPGERLFPRKRLLVFAGNRIMYDGPSVYWHGLYPFSQLILDPIVWAPGGFSKYRSLKPLQDSINEIGAGTMDNIKKALNQTLISKRGSVTDKAWDKFFADMPGQKLQLTPNALITDLKFQDPPQLPAYVFQALVQYMLPSFDRHAGSIDPTQLGKKKQVPGGDSVEQLRDMMQAPFRLESRYVEAFLRDAGLQAVSNVIQFFTGKMRMSMFGGGGLTREDFDYKPDMLKPWSQPQEQHHRLFPFMVAQGSLHGASKDRDKAFATTLAMRKLISIRELYRRLDLANGDQILKEIMEEAQASSSMGGGGGRTPRNTGGQKKGKPV